MGTLELDLATLGQILVTCAEVLSLLFIPLVLLRRKEPSSTFAWIFVLLAFPALGVVLFWYLGRDRVRRPVRTRLAIAAQLRQRLGDRLTGTVSVTDAARHSLIDAQPEELRGVMRVASKMGRAPLVQGNRVSLLVGAEKTYASLVLAIDAAQREVHLEFYAFRKGVTTQRVIEALERAAQRGVKVRLLYDAFGSIGVNSSLRTLRKHGGQARPFFPLDPIRRAATINLRNHRKLVVVDGTLGYCGGINVGDEFVPWRDVMMRIEGPAVAPLQAIFLEDWFFAAREELDNDASFPPLTHHGETVMQIVQSGPDESLETIHRLYFTAIASARSSVWISTPYFVPDKAILLALQTAALRGVDVRIVLPAHSNFPITKWAGESFFEELLDAGVRIFRLNFELIAVLYDPHWVAELARLHEEDQARSKQLSAAAWSTRGVNTRVKEGIGRLFSPML